MNEPMIYLGYIAVILFLGILTTILSKKIRLPNVLLLVVLGIVMGQIEYGGGYLVSFPDVFIVSVGILALVMIVFDSTSRLKLKEFDKESVPAIELTVVSLILTIIPLTLATYFFYDVPLSIALLFSAIMVGTAPDVVLSLMKDVKNKVLELLEVEAIINTPLIVIIPFLILEFIEAGISTETFATQFLNQILPFIQQLVVGIGSGILVGILIFKVMKKAYSEMLSPLALIVAALLTYVLAEVLQGSGVLAVTTLGLFFGSVYVTHKGEMQEFSSFFSYALEILVFVLIGLIIQIDLTLRFLALSLSLFLLLVLLRYLAVNI
ncbi:hypothetical protein GF345_00885, partial [Candidatus Woesearchaeota archaeon]|nr:hypothetical protein [Candidatus Woesearchaeota archaeon]